MNADTTAVLVLRMLKTPGVGPARVSKVLAWLKESGSAAEDFLARPQAIKGVLNEEQIAFLAKDNSAVEEMLAQMSSIGARPLFVGDPLYPRRLNATLGDKAPPMLTYLGNPELMNSPAVGFCGSRKASERGIAVTADCSSQLAEASMNVVSGYATGVDMEAHGSALRAGGTTAIVLAEGILDFRIKKIIADAWDWKRTVVVSEFLPGAMWSVANAMQRNKTIIGLSDAMILIEAGATGGSIEAGKVCLKMSHPLFAPVYEGMPESAVGNRELLKVGAKPLLRSRTTGKANMTNVMEIVRRARQPEATQ